MSLKKRLCILLLTAVAAAPVLFGADGSVAANNAPAANTANTANGPDPAAAPASLNLPPAVPRVNVKALLSVLVTKGILAPSEAKSIQGAAPGTEMQALVEALSSKGLLNSDDLSAIAALTPAAPAPAPAPAAPAASASASPAPDPAPAAASQTPPTASRPTTLGPPPAAAPRVVPAVAPIRVLPIDPPVNGGLVAAFKLGAVKMAPYGFIKSTVEHDSSNPRGDDFPLPGFLNADTGPTLDPAWHIKARSSRIGANFEWPDFSPKITLTGKVEADFEGNFSRADNRNVSSIRSNAFQLRLAYVRADYAVTDKTDLFLVAGQDWTIFGSSALSNQLETTFQSAYFGNVYERSPQMRIGFVQKLGSSKRNFKFSPEFAIMMPSEGNLPADVTTCSVPAGIAVTTTVSCTVTNGLGNQLGYGERQGSDADRLEYEGKAVLQWQLDLAPAVAPAQLIFSTYDSRREAIVLGSAIAAPAGSSAAVVANYAAAKEAFPHGVTDASDGYGLQVAAQLPTRWATLVASAYRGADLRFMFGGQTLSNYNNSTGLTNAVSLLNVDASSTVIVGKNAAGQEVAAPQMPVRGYGGFLNLGLPISRWFNANPSGHNAGWSLYFTSGVDAVDHYDFMKAKAIGASGAGPYRSTSNIATLYWRFNPWCTFAFEQSLYSSYALPNELGIYTANTSVRGVPSHVWRDLRSEFGPIFTF